MWINSVGRRVAWSGLIVAITATGPTMTSALRQGPRQPAAPYQYALGSATISIPPPKGFEEVLSRFEDIRARFPDTDRLETFAAHLPADVVKTFVPGQELTFYTKVSISKAIKTSDWPEASFAELKNQMASSNPYDTADLRKYLAEVERQRGLTVTQPVQMGVIDQTPRSITTLAMMTLGAQGRKRDLLAATSVMYLRRRLFYVYSYRAFETAADIAVLTEFTKGWIRAIVAANE